MLFIFKVPATAKDAEVMLDRLLDQAIEVMQPTNRRRLGQRRNYLNACYDQLYLKSNTLANKPGNKDWEAVAVRCNEDKKILSGTKEQMQANDITLY